MKALVFVGTNQPLQLQERPAPTPQAGQVVVQLKAASLNRRDYWITQGKYPGIKSPCILGSDGAGLVVKTGPAVESSWQGKEVILNPGMEWGQNPAAQSSDFHILGMPNDGTFATEIIVSATLLHLKPAHLSWPEAAALPLAGLTAYRALFTQGKLRAGEKLLVTGIGGGVASFALQFGAAAGAQVWVTSSSPHKIQRAVELGAVAGFDYTNEGWGQEFQNVYGAADMILDSAGGPGYGSLLEVAGPGGRIVNYGATAGPPPRLDLFKLFWKQLHLIGSTMGSPEEFQRMVEFVNQHQLKPVVDEVLPLAEGNQALERMKSSSQFGKLVLEGGV